MRIKDASQKCVSYRISDEVEDAKLISGMPVRVHEHFQEAQEALVNNDYSYDGCQLFDKIYDQFDHIQGTLKNHGSMSIHEDYYNWKENDQRREVAKLLLVDQADQGVLNIFFDDNADEAKGKTRSSHFLNG